MMSTKFLCPRCFLGPGFSAAVRDQVFIYCPDYFPSQVPMLTSLFSPQSRSLYTKSRALPLLKHDRALSRTNPRTQAQLGFATSARSYAAAKPSSDLVRKWASEGSATGTYVSYGFTEKLFEACSAQADYRMPKKGEYSELPPKTEGGEDVGIGEGLWYSGRLSVCTYMLGREN
jgi:cytochrome b pre-mRNA-processing protein 3